MEKPLAVDAGTRKLRIPSMIRTTANVRLWVGVPISRRSRGLLTA